MATLARLKVEGQANVELRVIIDCLQAVEDAYESIYALDVLIAKAENSQRGDWRTISWKRPALKPVKTPAQLILPGEWLFLAGAELHSPGIWDLIGVSSVLDTIRKYLADRHERRKDREYREVAEKEKLSLENQRLLLQNEAVKADLVRSRIELLQRLGYSEDDIRRIVSAHVYEPLSQLDRYQDSGVIGSASLETLANPQIEGRGTP